MNRICKSTSAVCILVLVLALFLSSCNSILNWFYEPTIFSELETGENFNIGRDGYYKKLSDNYCLLVLLGETTMLFKVQDEALNIPFGEADSHLTYNSKPYLRAHFIKCYFTDDYIVFCEEFDREQYNYVVFYFKTGEIETYTDEQTVYSLFSFDSSQWHSLCNTFEQKHWKNRAEYLEHLKSCGSLEEITVRAS